MIAHAIVCAGLVVAGATWQPSTAVSEHASDAVQAATPAKYAIAGKSLDKPSHVIGVRFYLWDGQGDPAPQSNMPMKECDPQHPTHRCFLDVATSKLIPPGVNSKIDPSGNDPLLTVDAPGFAPSLLANMDLLCPEAR